MNVQTSCNKWGLPDGNVDCKSYFRRANGRESLFHVCWHHWKCLPALYDTTNDNKIGGLCFTLCTIESVLLQHISREALTPVRAWCVDTSVVADVFIYQALIHVLHLNRTLHRILPVPLPTDGEGLFRVQAVRHYSTWREWLLFSRVIKLYNDMNNCITSLKQLHTFP